MAPGMAGPKLTAAGNKRAYVPPRIEIGLAELNALPEQHQQLAARLTQYEEQLAAGIAEQEKQRADGIAAAEAALAAYEKEVAPRETDLQQKHNQRIAQAETALREHEKRLPELLAAWEQQAGQPIAWTPLDPAELTATNGAKLEKQDDLSIFVTGQMYAREVIPHPVRQMVTVAALSVLEKSEELELHIAAALNVGCKPKELAEVIFQVGIYGGVPAMNQGLKALRKVLEARGMWPLEEE